MDTSFEYDKSNFISKHWNDYIGHKSEKQHNREQWKLDVQTTEPLIGISIVYPRLLAEATVVLLTAWQIHVAAATVVPEEQPANVSAYTLISLACLLESCLPSC